MPISSNFSDALKHLLDYVHLPHDSHTRITSAIDEETEPPTEEETSAENTGTVVSHES